MGAVRSASSDIFTDLIFGAECDDEGIGRGLSNVGWNFINDSRSRQKEVCDLGLLQWMVEGYDENLAGKAIGDLYIHWDIELTEPVLHASIMRAAPMDTFIGHVNDAVHDTTHGPEVFCPTMYALSQNNIGCTLEYLESSTTECDGLVLRFPDYITGMFKVDIMSTVEITGQVMFAGLGGMEVN